MQQVIHHAETDGVPTLFAYAAGPMRAGLVFRVGIADETLSGAGITHLVEHLALHRQGLADYHYNGATKAAFTHFHAEGAEHEVVAYLNGTCASLLDLPMERLETEKEILRTEEAGRDTSSMARRRYGAQGFGLVSYPEWGTGRIGPEDLYRWAGHWFTRDNAVLWIAGANFPAGLSLRLPAGSRRPVPPANSLRTAGPVYFSAGTGGVLLESVVRHTTAAQLYGEVVQRELFRSLRQEGGYSYTAATAYERRGDGGATLTAFADALPTKQDAVLGGFVDTLARLEAGWIEQSGLDAVRVRADAALIAPDAVSTRLPAAAEELLIGRPPRSTDDLRAELWAVTPAHLHAVAVEAAGTALMQVPSGLRADWAGFSVLTGRSEVQVRGRRFEALGKDGSALIVADEGVSLTDGDESVTVLFRDCVAVLAWSDGGRHLIGADGVTVPVEPALYGVDPQTMLAVDAAAPSSAQVGMPPRRAPVPREARATPASPPGTAGRRQPTRRTRAQAVVLAVFGVLAVVWSFCALALSVAAAADSTTSVGILLVLFVFFWGPAALLAWPAVRILRRTRRV